MKYIISITHKYTGIKLTPEQIENWRKILSAQIGPYAYLMSVELIEQHRNKLQEQLNQGDKK